MIREFEVDSNDVAQLLHDYQDEGIAYLPGDEPAERAYPPRDRGF